MHYQPEDLVALLDTASQRIADPDDATAARDAMTALAVIETATPTAAPLHAQLDHVRRWLVPLQEPGGHDRFGGAEHLRSHVLTQLRMARGALDDYLRETM